MNTDELIEKGFEIIKKHLESYCETHTDLGNFKVENTTLYRVEGEGKDAISTKIFDIALNCELKEETPVFQVELCDCSNYLDFTLFNMLKDTWNELETLKE